MEAVRRAAEDMGYTPINCGKVPSPAVALYGLVSRAPAIMVTGSHIPADRNGIKFNKCSGEILKADETSIRQQCVRVDESLFSDAGLFVEASVTPWPLSNTARALYVARYLDCFPADCLTGQRIGVYQHSAVGRDMLVEIYQGLGAEVVSLGRSETFVPVDTEAIRPEDVALATQWAEAQRFDAIVSTDGDSDRPLIADETGQWLRGDVAGILSAGCSSPSHTTRLFILQRQ
jgi:phosphomannomutase